VQEKLEELDEILYGLKDSLQDYPLSYKVTFKRQDNFKNEGGLQYQVLENESDIDAFEQFHIPFDKVIKSYKESLPNETIIKYHFAVRDAMGFLERARGPIIVTELFHELYQEKELHVEIDNPQVFFDIMMQRLITSVGSENRMCLEYMKTLHITIEEALRYLKN